MEIIKDNRIYVKVKYNFKNTLRLLLLKSEDTWLCSFVITRLIIRDMQLVKYILQRIQRIIALYNREIVFVRLISPVAFRK